MKPAMLTGLTLTMAAAVAASFALLMLGGRAPDYDGGPLGIQGADSVTSGDTISLHVDAPEAPNGASLDLLIAAGYRSGTLHARIEDGVARITVPESLAARIGDVTVTAVVGAQTASHRVTVLPGPAVDPVLPLLGARSIVADGRDTAMVAFIPEDEHGNPIEDGAEVSMRVERPDGSAELAVLTVSRSLAWSWITSRTTAGRTYVSGATGRARGPEAHLLEVPDVPRPFGISVVEARRVADGASIFTVQTDPLIDAHGNLAVDGTAVRFVAEHDGKVHAIADGETIGGVARTLIRVPSRGVELTIRAAAGTSAGDSLRVQFTDGLATAGVPVTTRPEGNDVRVDVGPILGPSGQLVPDGSSVEIAIDSTGRAAESHRVETAAGRATALLRTPAPFKVTVRVGSAETTVEIRP